MNGIAIDERPRQLLPFKRILYAECEDDLEEHYDSLVSDEVMMKYSFFLSMLQMYIKTAHHGHSVTESTYSALEGI